MNGDIPINAKLSGNNAGSKALAKLINEMGEKLDRPWHVRKAADGQTSQFLASKEQVTLLIANDVTDTDGLILRVQIGGTAQDVFVPGASVIT